MSRDATAWSVKGIDQATRDIARRAAAASGMTIGEWIDHAIKSDAANRGVPVVGGGPAGQAPQRIDGVSADTAEAVFSRIADGEQLFEARLRPIAYALKDVAERVVALEREAEQLPPPADRQIDVLSSPAEHLGDDAPAERRPIELRPITGGTAARPPAEDGQAQDAVERPRPTPIEFRPIEPPAADLQDGPISFEPEPEDTEPEDTEPQGRATPGRLPEGPPDAWSPYVDLDRSDLARQAGQGPQRRPEATDAEAAEPMPAAASGVDVDEDPTTLRRRPEPVPPTHDFSADPIDTRALGLSGEAIPTPLPPRRVASAGRLAIAAVIVLALIGGAVWTAHRQGTLSLGALGERLAEAERSVHLALIDATDWVMHLAFSTEHDPSEASPAADHGTAEQQPAADTDQPPRPDDPPAEVAAAAPQAPVPSDAKAETAGQAPPPAAEAPKPASAGDGAAETPKEAAPPLPETTIEVDPRIPAPPPAPAIDGTPTRTASAAPALQGAAAPLSRAEAGNPAAQFEVAAGMMRAAEPRPAEAATWFREAAINGLDVAQFNLGVMYELGLGVPEDQTRALLWYHSAAEQGHPLAQYNLGRLYALGKGIPQSDTEAQRWFRRAADRGVAAAQYALAIFEPGENERERMMYTAAKAGAEDAQAWLRARSAGETPDAPLGAATGLVLDPPTGAPDIAAIQEGLAGLGYYKGPIDGIAGPMTRAAIGRFQSDNGLPATGLPSRSLRQRLN